MNATLPPVEVVRRQIEESFDLHAPLYVLHWRGRGERLWELPDGVCLAGQGPGRFGYRLQRRGEDRYDVQLLWDRTRLGWTDLSRVELLASCLSPLLGALGVDLWSLLDQAPARPVRLRAA